VYIAQIKYQFLFSTCLSDAFLLGPIDVVSAGSRIFLPALFRLWYMISRERFDQQTEY